MTERSIIFNTPEALASSMPSVKGTLSNLRVDMLRNNDNLYLILGHVFILARKIDFEPSMQAELDEACEKMEIKCHRSTPGLNRVLRYITDDDQGKANNYAAALKKLPPGFKTAEDIAKFITDSGGLEKLRLSGKGAKQVRLSSPPKVTAPAQASSDGSSEEALQDLVKNQRANADANLASSNVGGTATEQADAKSEATSVFTGPSTVPGKLLQPDFVDDEIQSSIVPEDDADDQASHSCRGAVESRRVSIPRSAITPATVGKGDLVIIGFEGYSEMSCIVDYPGLTQATAAFVAGFMKNHPVKPQQPSTTTGHK